MSCGLLSGMNLATVLSSQSGRKLSDRRELGAFYTPVELSRILSDWAINSPDDTVLEPSFGGCGFLEAARSSLEQLGSHNPAASIFGCDIDPVAFEHLSTVFMQPVDLQQFRQIDFLDCKAGDGWPNGFTTILANPPYIPHQRIGRDRQSVLAERKWEIPGIGGRASLWAYFLAHGISLLKEGGRMAWVLPGAALQADYAASIRAYLGQHFKRCAAIIIRERLFLDEGADEETVILLGDGHHKYPSDGVLEIGEAQSTTDLRDIVARWSEGTWTGNMTGTSPATLSLTAASRQMFEVLSEQYDCQPLGAYARVQIGIVTGANPFFVLPAANLDSAGLQEEDCSPILAKFRQAAGLAFTALDHQRALEKGERSLLVDTRRQGSNPRIQAYIMKFDPEQRAKIGTFRKRAVWHQPCDGKFPDAFLPVMHHHGPRLVMNVLGCNSTNTVHRVFFRDHVTPQEQKLLSISLLSTFSQISAELVGRRYGSGVLKHEPRDAERIQVLMPDCPLKQVDQIYARIDKSLRSGQHDEAQAIADHFLLGRYDLPKNALGELRDALISMRERRRPNRSVSASVY